MHSPLHTLTEPDGHPCTHHLSHDMWWVHWHLVQSMCGVVHVFVPIELYMHICHGATCMYMQRNMWAPTCTNAWVREFYCGMWLVPWPGITRARSRMSCHSSRVMLRGGWLCGSLMSRKACARLCAMTHVAGLDILSMIVVVFKWPNNLAVLYNVWYPSSSLFGSGTPYMACKCLLCVGE